MSVSPTAEALKMKVFHLNIPIENFKLEGYSGRCQSHLEGLLKTDCQAPSRVSDSLGLDWVQEFAFLTSI